MDAITKKDVRDLQVWSALSILPFFIPCVSREVMAAQLSVAERSAAMCDNFQVASLLRDMQRALNEVPAEVFQGDNG